MTGLSWRGLQERAGSLTGAFIALVLGVSLTTASGAVLVQASSPDARVMTAGAEALTQAAALLVMLAVIGAFVTTFIVASTFAFSVAQRRRELARLRLVGATPRQISRYVLAEAVIVAAAAGIAGALLGAPTVQVLIWLLSVFDVVPEDLQVPLSADTLALPAVIAATLGCGVAVAGSGAAARRAGRVAPAEALRDAAADQHVMTRGRWIAGVLATGVGVAMLVVIPLAPPDGRLPLALFVAQPLVIACAMLAPVLVVPVTALITGPASRLSTVSALLARRNLATAVRRTASTATPVLLLVGVSGSLLAGVGVLAAANRQDARLLHTSDLIAVSTRAPDLREISTVPGVAASSRLADTQVEIHVNRTTRSLTALGVDADGASAVLRLGGVDGKLSELTGDAVAVPRAIADSYNLNLGGRLSVRLADGTSAVVRVVAIFDGTPLSTPLLLPFDFAAHHRSNTATQGPDKIAIVLTPDATADAVTDRLSQSGGAVLTTDQYVARISDPRAEGMRIGALLLAVFALTYTLVAVANTTVMSFADRYREFVRLRVIGASRAQLMRMVLWEAIGSAVTGIAFGAAVITVAVGGLWAVLRNIGLKAPIDLPWAQLAAISAAAIAVVLIAAAIPAAALLHRGYHASDLST